MAFTGTLDKCKACDKTVYFVDLLTADGIIYHRNCFKCTHCKGLLVMSNYSSLDGILYCKPHFEQLFKESGNFSKNFITSPKGNLKPPSKLCSFFSGTIDKCSTCNKKVYPLDKMTMEGEIFHKSCFKCAHGGCPLTHYSYASLDGVLYCRHHFAQLFMEKGNFTHVLQAATLRRIAMEQPVSPVKKSTELSEPPSSEEEEEQATYKPNVVEDDQQQEEDQ
ncbi:hypothetical protein LguiA_019129 [Lonicera macranthoides]